MRKVTFFLMDACPYCRQALKAIEELKSENELFQSVEFDQIEITRSPEKTGGYDFHYVPTMFIGGAKLYEARPGETYPDCKEKIRAVLESAVQ